MCIGDRPPPTTKLFFPPPIKSMQHLARRSHRAETMAQQPLVLSLLLLVGILACIAYTGADAPPALQQQCSAEVNKLLGCLDYSTGKASEPSVKCCSSAKEAKEQKPACLCLVIQQTFEGSPQIKQLGLKADRLLQLPAACKLANASTSDCPKLLNLSPTSPDYAIFTNKSTAAISNSSSSSSPSSSDGYVSGPRFTWAIMMSAAAVLFKL